jgi:hypothetical protein
MTGYEHAAPVLHMEIFILLNVGMKYGFQQIESKRIVKKRMLINIRFFT